MHERQRAGQAGFTLIEAMFAIIVLSFGLIAVINLFLVAATSNFIGSQTTAAANVASEQLEWLRMMPFNGVNGLVAGGDLDSDLGPAAACPGGPGEFSCVQDVPGVGRMRLRWTIQILTPASRGIIVEALPIEGLASGRARARLTTIRTCTLSTEVPISCPPPI